MRLNDRNIFLLDGAGAILSAAFTGFFLPRYSLFLGINVSLLQTLSLIPLCFAVYSLSCYFLTNKTKSWMLLAIIIANSLYSLLSLAIILLRERITWRGQLFLAAEIAVILLVIFLELKIYSTTNKKS